MGKKNLKQPATQKGRISPRVDEEPSPQTLPPHFSFEHLRDNAHFGLSSCDKDQKAALAERLGKLSAMTWAQIKDASRHGLGSEKIARDAIRAPIPPTYKDDYFLAIRFAGAAPMVGYQDGRAFLVLWLDPKFKLYDHG